MQSDVLDRDKPVYLPSCEHPLVITARQIDELTSTYDAECTFAVTVRLSSHENIDPDKVRHFLVVAHEVKYPHRPTEMQIKQILQRKAVMCSLTAAEVHLWLTNGATMRRRDRGRLLEELREAIAPRLVRQHWI